ncbi:MAG: hypothetical protein SNH55_04700 [Rikenellaceae bacterium]
MINAAFDFLEFLHSNFAFLFSLVLYTVLAIALSKSIKKNYKVYYTIFGLLSFAFIIPVIFRLCGATFPISFGSIPLFGPCISELSSGANFLHPVLVIIMYMGAFSPKNQYIGRLMSIRKELSIIVGFPVLAHAMKRIFGSFVEGWKFFFDHEEFMQSPRVSSVLGSGISSFVYVLGIVMFTLFLVLWITSFDSVHRKLGTKRWKSIQKWSYGLYAMLFIHALGLQVGSLISSAAREKQMSQQPRTEQVQMAHGAQTPQQGGESRGPQQAQAGQGGAPQQGQAPQAAQQHGHGRPKSFSFVDNITISRTTKSWIHIFTLFLVYGSYLYFRLRKAKNDKAKRMPRV